MTAPKTRTITLTDRRPVTIREDEWPLIAIGFEPYGVGERLANRHTIRVRQHADGRTLVYGVVNAETATGWRGGELLTPVPVLAYDRTPLNLAAAIRRVGESGRFPDAVIRACIAVLPAERL